MRRGPLCAFVLLLLAACRDPNRPPDAPAQPLGPARGYTDTAYAFFAAAADPDGDSVCYRFDWGDGDTSDWCPPSGSGEGSRLAHAWTQPGDYVVHTQAQDANQDLSPWSIGCPVTIADTHPINWAWSEEYVLGSPVIVQQDGAVTIYFSADEHFCAVGLDGQTRATVAGMVEDELFWGHPAYCAATGNIIVGNEEGELHAFNTDLERSWHWPGNSTERTVDYLPWGTAAVRGETLYVVRENAYQDSDLYCFLDLGAAGCLLGHFVLDDAEVSGGPVIDQDGNVLVCTSLGAAYKLSPGIDSLLWMEYFGGDLELLGPAIGPDGSVYVSTSGGKLEALEPDGSYKWSAYLGGAGGVPVVGNGAVFVGTDDGDLFSVDATDGSINWSVRLEADSGFSDWFCNSPALTANGLVYALGEEALYCCRQTDGELLWLTRLQEPSRPRSCFFEVPGSPTITPGGDIIAPDEDGVLYCIAGGPAAFLARTAWPKWQRDLYNSGYAGIRR